MVNSQRVSRSVRVWEWSVAEAPHSSSLVLTAEGAASSTSPHLSSLSVRLQRHLLIFSLARFSDARLFLTPACLMPPLPILISLIALVCPLTPLIVCTYLLLLFILLQCLPIFTLVHVRTYSKALFICFHAAYILYSTASALVDYLLH